MANLQNILTKTNSGEIGMFIKVLEKMNFLREQCNVKNPYFLAFMETWIKDETMEAKYAIDGYEHVASHRKNRKRGSLCSLLFFIRIYCQCPPLADG